MTISLQRPIARATIVGSAPRQQPAAADQDLSLARQALEQELASRSAELELAMAALSDAAGKLQEMQEQAFAHAEDKLLDLALDIARKVLMQEIQAGRYQIEPIVREALTQVRSRQDVVARLNAGDLANCPMAQDQSLHIRFVADPSVGPGECVLETAEGLVESRIEPHLQSIGEALRGAR